MGQSLYSAHLDAVYGPNHKYIDPQIWYDEQEMRKQIEQSCGAFILTAQEKPETSRKLREDLFKKTMSADGIAGRKPYGVQTRMIECVGWKRCELNAMFRFSGVTEENFNSALRRGFVWAPKARFIDSSIINETYPDANLDGYFSKDDELKEFLRSSPAVLASLRLQHAFEVDNSRAHCRDMIEQYASGSFTEDCMREACNLRVQKRSSETKKTLQVPVDESSQEADAKQKELLQQLRNVASAIRDHCLDKNKTMITKGMWKYVKLPSDHPKNLDRDSLWEALLTEKMILRADVKSNKYKDSAFPAVTLTKGLRDVISVKALASDVHHQELQNIRAAKRYAHGNADREANVACIIQFLNLKTKQMRSAGRRGKQSTTASEKIREAESLSKKLSEREEHMSSWIDRLCLNQIPAKKRRTGKTPMSQEEELPCDLKVEVGYSRSFHDLVRTRAYAQQNGVQKFSRCLQRTICSSDTKDLDIENSVFCVLHQLLCRLNTNSEIEEWVIAIMKRCAQERQAVCKQELNTSVRQGKQILHEVLFGGNASGHLPGNVFLQKLQKASIYLRWLACSLLPDVYETVLGMSDKPNPEASTLFYLYAAAEDYILEAWEACALQHKPAHLSLHFDGIRLGGLESTIAADALCKEAMCAIRDKTQFEVNILEKRHLFFRELCRTPAESSEDAIDDVLLAHGNCIPLALARLLPGMKDAIIKSLAKPGQKNSEASQCGSRCYRSVLDELQLHAEATLKMNVEDQGLYLLHVEHDGNPHCLACKVRENNLVEMWDGNYKTRMLLSELQDFAREAIDASSLVTFHVFQSRADEAATPPNDSNSPEKCLFGLHAGAGRMETDWEGLLSNPCECSPPEPGSDDECEIKEAEEDEEEEPVVAVGNLLLGYLQKEVSDAIKNSGLNVRLCPFCPFRSFQRHARVREHMEKYHTKERQFVCSGTKQLKIVCALFDHDQLAGGSGKSYLRRSADILRASVQPPLSAYVNDIDRHIRLVLTAHGPEFWHQETLLQRKKTRRVRNLYYTKDFGDIVYRELLLCHAKCKAVTWRR